MPVPIHLKHHPIVAVDYQNNDISSGYGDTHYLSIGSAQWDSTDFSAKAIRRSGNRWSRQSEEIPLLRLLDLAILEIAVIKGKACCLNQTIVDKSMHQDLMNFINNHQAQIDQRLNEIKKLL
ncbi:MAG: hypothetical protein HDS75_06670 [Bacteroidales bacterium]|nr:hypothetical protein [Bacteroidales bacterium]